MGVRIPQYGTDWPTLRHAARHAEALGFHGLWVNDHLQSPGRRPGEPAFDALTTLAALAPLTQRARLGVAVLSASYRPPALAAKMASVLDVIAGGRVTLGLGAGSDRSEHAAYGFPFGTAGERTEGVIEALEVMRALFRAPEEGADLEGRLRGAPNRPAPAQAGGPPIWLAAHRPRMLRLAGEQADGVVAAFCDAAELGRRRARAEEAREGARRPPLAYALYTYVLPLGGGGEAEGWLAAEAEALGTTSSKLVRWLRTTGIVGSAAEIRDALSAFADAGATDAILVLPNRVPPEAFDALAEATLADDAGADDAPAAAPASAAAVRAPGAGLRGDDNLAHLLVGRHRADAGEAVAAVDDDGEWSFEALGAAGERAAGALAVAGVRPGDRVALALPDGRAWLAGFLGAAGLGAVPVPLDPAGDAEGLASILADCEPAAVVVAEPDDEEGPGAPARAGGWPVLAAEALADGPARGHRAVHPRDLAYLIYSSGSTGRPKAAMHAHADLRPGVEGYAAQTLGLGPDDRCHSVAKLFTSLGFGNGFFRVLGCGATAVLAAGRPNVRTVLGQVAEHGVSVLTAVPTFWAQLAAFLERHPDPEALAGVRLLISSGDRLPAPVAERLRAVADAPLLEGLGCSECSNIVISQDREDPPGDALGRATPGVELRLADDEGHPVPDGEPGRLWIRSNSNTTGYWRRGEETRELVYGPWLRMGDMMSQQDGVYRHLGRADDLFKVDARWVSPGEVEGALLGHPAVGEAAVVARPDDDGLLRPAAFVVLSENATDADDEDQDDLADVLRRQVARALAPYKAPRWVTVLDALPRLPSGKLDRRSLRES